MSINEQIANVSRHLRTGCYRLISLNASEHSFVVVMSTLLNEQQLAQRGFPFLVAEEPAPEEDDDDDRGFSSRWAMRVR